ncbi:SIMPL domain-containing protein [Aquibacillus sediminis]|uniref:SIMPL domain-containing protein n=1 Tax=Aquibacillus sediminis TaxID=2574734 RepID=UPI001485FE7D|nr:SIMPL domain-containing protein [Aquibacillus sediminis]
MYYPPVRQTDATVSGNRMTVFGTGKVSVEPNLAVLQLGVVTQTQALSSAQQENARLIDQVIRSLTGLGVSQQQIQTIDYTIVPRYNYVDGEQQFIGYQVTHMLSVTVENINQIGTVIDTAVKNGANRVISISLTVKDRTAHYQKALQLAIENAFTKANTITNSVGQQLHPTPIKIQELPTESQATPYHTFASTEVGGVSTPIEPGTLDIEANVEMKFTYG